MTKEELKQEAEEWVQNNNYSYSNCPNIEKKLKQAYLAGAEPREKRIAELEKENAELKNKVTFLEDNLRVARKDRENLQLDVAKGLKEFVKDYPATSFRYLANEKYVEQFTKAKELIDELSSSLSVVGECGEEECELLNRVEQFLHSEVEK